MAGEPLAGRGGGGPEIVELGSVPGFVGFDLPGMAVSAGGTRLAPDVSVAEVALLARAMTYKFAALGDGWAGPRRASRGSGRPRGRAALMARFCAEIRSAGRFGPVPDRAGHGHGRGGLRAAARAPGRAGSHQRRRGRRAVRGCADRVRRDGGRGGGAERGWGRAGTAVRWLSRGSARWAAGWRARSPAAAAGWSRYPPWPGAWRTRPGWTSNGCSRCAARTAMLASCATAGRQAAGRAVHGGGGGCRGARNPAGRDRRPDAGALPPGSGSSRWPRTCPTPPRGRGAAPARHRGAARLRLQRGRGHRLPVGRRRYPGRGPGRGRRHDHRTHRRGAGSSDGPLAGACERAEGSCAAGGASRPTRRSRPRADRTTAHSTTRAASRTHWAGTGHDADAEPGHHQARWPTGR